MSKAILTKYLPATNTKPSRVKAYDCDGNSITVPYTYDDLYGNQAYINAANALKNKMGWKGELIGGHTKDGMAFVFMP